MHVVIVGASVRAAAFSACRAGLKPIAVDLFADSDLRAIAPAHRVAPGDYPGALPRIAATLAPGPWMYTGALENQFALVARLARQRPLWGNDAECLRAVRDPFLVAEALRWAGLGAPAVRRSPDGLPRDGSWLIKPLASGGGRGIVPWERPLPTAVETPCYYQERIEGTSLAAVFVASRGRAEVDLLGVTRQWIGRPGAPFAYAGSLGPWPLRTEVRARIEALGVALVRALGLVGLFGVDLILRGDQPWPVEVNPRYTASVEVLELASGRSLVAEHARACDPEAALAAKSAAGTPRPRFVGKLIVYARRQCSFPGIAERTIGAEYPFAIPAAADIPGPGATFERGEPVLTLLAHGPDASVCRRALKQRRAWWLKRLRDSTGS